MFSMGCDIIVLNLISIGYGETAQDRASLTRERLHKIFRPDQDHILACHFFHAALYVVGSDSPRNDRSGDRKGRIRRNRQGALYPAVLQVDGDNVELKKKAIQKYLRSITEKGVKTCTFIGVFKRISMKSGAS
jgi:hypothetical protein